MTHSRWPGGRSARILVTALVLAGTITAFGLARALAAPAGCQNWTGAQPPNPGGRSNTLDSVAIESACDAWAVGSQTGGGIDATLTEHWNGSAWTVVPSPALGPASQLRGVRGTSASDVWAVGSYFDDTANMRKTLILHWDGHAWTQVTSPSPGGTDNELFGVRAVSGTDAWAVGYDVTSGSTDQTLILHWDGTAWTQVASPSPGTAGTVLEAVAATSSTDAWAVGSSFTADTEKTLTLHWNGHKWAQVASPNRGTDDELFAVRGTSSSDTWAVGVSVIGGVDQTLALHWNGSTWTRVATPDPGGSGVSSDLVGVAGTAANDTWAVGSTGPSGSAKAITRDATLILHWDGSHWTQVPSPGPEISSDLFAVAASSTGNIWAVGESSDGQTDHTLAVHCC
jgi:erythromycin esterase-like protein